MSTSHQMTGSHPVGKAFLAGLQYFAIVFGIGFLLGIIRTRWLEPQMGTRLAELTEMPAMLLVIVLAARWVVRRGRLSRISELIGVGTIAFALMLAAELSLVLLVRGLSFAEYVRTRDAVAGAVYIFMLAVFALMPLHCGRARY